MSWKDDPLVVTCKALLVDIDELFWELRNQKDRTQEDKSAAMLRISDLKANIKAKATTISKY